MWKEQEAQGYWWNQLERIGNTVCDGKELWHPVKSFLTALKILRMNAKVMTKLNLIYKKAVF